jgi:acetylglutamate kinase
MKGEKWNVFWYGLSGLEEVRFAVEHCRTRPATLKG